MSSLKLLFIGDIMGKSGRAAIKKALPELKEKYNPDLIIANAENLAHGKGVTESTLQEMLDIGIDFFTSGDHIWDNKKEIEKIFSENKLPIIRPANYPEGIPGYGYKVIEIGTNKILIVNLIGRVFFRSNFECPFREMEKILEQFKDENLSAIIVDFHAEATSEKNTLSRYFDGKVSAVLGTHTHIQTADEQILPNGTAHITDVGFVGIKNSSLGLDLKNVTETFLYQTPREHEIPEHGICQVNAVFVIIKPETKLAVQIERINIDVEI
ncbi:TIGR00282 family metallophosphoesterase [Patescibacteria group bacterium]|nr:TIGR00282 family metallophosphoesterase [Patescibacteria group bacterium]